VPSAYDCQKRVANRRALLYNKKKKERIRMALPKEKHVTYRDYASWDEDVRCEVLDGRIISMNFSPSPKHQIILANLGRLMGNQFEGTGCQVMMAPCDVFLFADETGPTDNTDQWVEPDLFVLCHEKGGRDKRIGDKGIYGAPDLVVEILSPSNPKNDKVYKLNKYEHAGVKEYWIVDPFYQMVDVYILKGENLQLTHSYGVEDTMTSDLFNDLSVDLKQVFTE
jgi:Uma2 family endonuclease